MVRLTEDIDNKKYIWDTKTRNGGECQREGREIGQNGERRNKKVARGMTQRHPGSSRRGREDLGQALWPCEKSTDLKN